ncbi:GntR family transcriptional regulator [Rhodococcus aetherivorans]|nr:GntR family transcriptional regulator [Rhodococcus aetherivorans]ETT23559.1 transcriptional regulator, GntR family [Rhodococcus rhodochrous ATCC 21198]KDE12482.1 GntR family transcriptional regulator [Rhodococcus aetherivorans]MDV6296669.1 GntR family transcriptional regulator [Rhodococcus aetherivorans]NGP28321.1 GntR family transcriptional regulator [Rhodococcus aetherivorans]
MTTSARFRSADSTPMRRRPQLSDDVAVHVRNLIMSGSARPGDFIRLDETAAELGVSVTPVREALLTLRGEGLVELVPHRGYVVAPLSRHDINDLFWLQGRIAEELVVRATRTVTPQDIVELTELNTRLADAVESCDGARIEDLEFAFHRAVNRLADARKLAWFLLNATRYTPVTFYSSDPDWGTTAVQTHARLIDALSRRDAAVAGAVTSEHFADGAERLVRHLDEVGIWD